MSDQKYHIEVYRDPSLRSGPGVLILVFDGKDAREWDVLTGWSDRGSNVEAGRVPALDYVVYENIASRNHPSTRFFARVMMARLMAMGCGEYNRRDLDVTGSTPTAIVRPNTTKRVLGLGGTIRPVGLGQWATFRDAINKAYRHEAEHNRSLVIRVFDEVGIMGDMK